MEFIHRHIEDIIRKTDGTFKGVLLTGAFTVLDGIPEKKRGSGAVVCMCSQPGVLRNNVLAIPVWYL